MILKTLLVLTLFSTSTCNTGVVTSVCPPPLNGIPTGRCYKGLAAYLRSELDLTCSEISSKILNIDSVELAEEVIKILNFFQYYGIWIDAEKDKNDDIYKWNDGRLAPDPFNWCAGSTKTETNLVLICDPKLTYSMSTCCISDRKNVTEFALICLRT